MYFKSFCHFRPAAFGSSSSLSSSSPLHSILAPSIRTIFSDNQLHNQRDWGPEYPIRSSKELPVANVRQPEPTAGVNTEGPS